MEGADTEQKHTQAVLQPRLESVLQRTSSEHNENSVMGPQPCLGIGAASLGCRHRVDSGNASGMSDH